MKVLATLKVFAVVCFHENERNIETPKETKVS
jgi:hypothetical protein